MDLYNRWFLRFAPDTFRAERARATQGVLVAFQQTSDLSDLSEAAIRAAPGVLAALRMCCAPPLARDRLAGLALLSNGPVKSLEAGRVPKAGGVIIAALTAVI